MATKRSLKKKNTIFNAFFAQGSMDIPFLIILMTIVTVGLVMLFSASYTYSYYNRNSSTEIFSRQLVFAVIGVVAMLANNICAYADSELMGQMDLVGSTWDSTAYVSEVQAYANSAYNPNK